jgi:dihydrofolate reductase
MSVWEDMPGLDDQPGPIQEYARIWREIDKVVYSTTLSSTTTRRTRLERDFDHDAIRQTKHGAERDLSIGGPGLAGQALCAGLVDQCDVFLNPVVVGGGTAWLPQDVSIDLELLDEHRFDSGVVWLLYRVLV